MTVATDVSLHFEIDDVVRRGMQLSGLTSALQGEQSPHWAEKSAMIRDMLEMEMQSIQAEGLLVRAINFYDLTLVAATQPYTLPDETMDLVGDAMYTATGETTETPIRPMSRQEWQQLTNKATAGRAFQYYAHKDLGLRVYFYPVPDAANLGTVRFQRHRYLATLRDGSKQADFDRYFQAWMLWTCAHLAAVSGPLPVQHCGYLRSEAKSRLDTLRKYCRQRTDTDMIVEHRTPWSG